MGILVDAHESLSTGSRDIFSRFQLSPPSTRNHFFERVVFQVRYAPKVSLRIRSGLGKNGRIVEGSELRFKCRAEANPPNVEYR